MNNQRRSRKRHYFSKRGVFLAVVVAVCVLPLVWTLLASLQIWPDEAFTPPRWVFAPSLDQYLEVGIAQPEFIPELLTGTLLAVCTTLLTIAIAFFAAYSLARSRFRGRSIVVQSFLVLASLPVISYLIPLSNILDVLRLTNTFVGVALAETTLYTPLAVYVLFGYFNGISIDQEESARLDGATLLRILRSIVLPASLVGVVATAIILFVLSWNQLLIPLILSPRIRIIPTAMIDFFTYERELDWTTAAAALIVSFLPIGVFVALAHRSLEQFSLSFTINS